MVFGLRKGQRPKAENQRPMRVDVLTIFPEFFTQVFDFGIIRRAKLAGIVEINVVDIREFATDKHKMVDDRPFGGGDGMVLKP